MKKQIFGLIAIVIALSASAFTSAKHHAAKKTSDLNWYIVTYDDSHPNGAVLSSDDYLGDVDKSEITSPCPSGTQKDCLRGFASAITSFPSAATSPDDTVQRPN